MTSFFRVGSLGQSKTEEGTLESCVCSRGEFGRLEEKTVDPIHCMYFFLVEFVACKG